MTDDPSDNEFNRWEKNYTLFAYPRQHIETAVKFVYIFP